MAPANPGPGGAARQTLDLREQDICNRIALRVSEVLERESAGASTASINAIRDGFDEHIVALHNYQRLHELVRVGDAIGDERRKHVDAEFDTSLEGRTIQALPRVVVVELASLDGAVVLANSGRILAYGAVLYPKKAGRLRDVEGSRSKAAVGASNYGLAIKISADGGITVYYAGAEFIQT